MNTNYLLVGVVAIAIGGAFAGVAWTHIQPFQEDVENAESVDAVVVASSVVESTNAEGQQTYQPSVTYEYTYEGMDYESGSVFPGDVNPVSDRSRARDIVEQHPAGSEVTAYVNADDPEAAFLVKESVPTWYWAGPIVGALLILYGLYSIVLGVRGVEPAANGVE